MELLTLRVYTSVRGIRVHIHIQRLQRWLRRVCYERRRAKAAALAMGLHARLGVDSPLQGFGDDHLGLVLRGYLTSG
jgi:hypothetical protein